MARKTTSPLLAKVPGESPFSDIIEQAYLVFRSDTPTDTEVCKGCCMYPEIELDFFNPPIRELPLSYLQDWFFAACEPKLSKDIWGYLLPRILEVLACGEDPATVGREVSLNRFSTGDRTQWNSAQWRVLDAFQRQYFQQQVSNHDPYLDDTICMFGLAGWPLQDLFTQISGFPDAVLAERFYSDWCIGKPSIWITAFWEDGANSKAFEFYTSRRLYERMERLALNEATPPGLADKAMQVASVIVANADWAQPV